MLQPLTEEALKGSKIDVIEVDHTQIGKHVDAPLGEELAGRATTQTVEMPQGRAVISIVPVVKADGSVVGLVAVGITVTNVNEVVECHVPMLLGSGGAALLLAMGGAALVSGRLKRQTHGLGPTDMTRMYEHHEAVLHAVREGVLIIGGDGRLLLVNDEARRLLDLPPDAERRHVTDFGLDTRTAELLAPGRPATD